MHAKKFLYSTSYHQISKLKLKGEVHLKNNEICNSRFSYQDSKSVVIFYVSVFSNLLFLFKVVIFGHFAQLMKDAIFTLFEGQPRFQNLCDDV